MRSSSILFFVLAALLFFFVMWYGTTPASKPVATASTTDVAFTELARGDQSNVQTHVNYLITTPEQMKKLWHFLSTSVVMPSVDFDKYEVIAVFTGEEPTAGYTIAVTHVTDTSDARVVTVQVSAPGPSCSAAEVTTAPYQVLLLPKSDLPLTHADLATTTSCWQ